MSEDRDTVLGLWRPGCVWLVVGAGAGALAFLVLILAGPVLYGRSEQPAPTPVLTVVAYPSPTPIPATSPASTEEPTPEATATRLPGQGGDFDVGTLVEVVGTEGDGLRLREAPTLGAAIQVVGLDSEVFEVRDGPVGADGYTWWFLVNPYDRAKQGWAVGDYLRPLNPP